MICGAEVDVLAAVSALHTSPTAAAVAPLWQNVLQIALEFIDSGNDAEADAQLTRLLEHEPTNGAVWMCKALIAAGPDQASAYAEKGFEYGFAASDLKPAMAQRFLDRAVALIGLSEGADDGLDVERNSASGYIDEAHRQPFAAGVHCDFAYRYLGLALALLSVSYKLVPSGDVGDGLSLMETLVNHMPAAGRVIDSPEGYPYEAKNWFHYTLPAIYKLRQRVVRDFPDVEINAPVTPADTAPKKASVVPSTIIIGLLGFVFTFGIGILRGESLGLFWGWELRAQWGP